jgi:DNA (cytosine-5)-methyltransferase 1
MMNEFTFLEFFAGGGMARAGLGNGWRCSFANDFDQMKIGTYRSNWGGDELISGDVNFINTCQIPGQADLAWASFPCQDLSLAGNALGIGTVDEQTRSGAFWAFWKIIEGLIGEHRAPAVVVLENVYGSLTANKGRDFATIARCLALGGYRFGAMVIDAARFVPQSRPRVFIVAFRNDMHVPENLIKSHPSPAWHPTVMESAINRLSELDRESWLWLTPTEPLNEVNLLSDLILEEPDDVSWHSPSETQKLIAMMSNVNHNRLLAMQAKGKRLVGTIYKRTRVDGTGSRRQRAELRDDNIAGCLRTPGGGSSRQTIVVVEGASVRTRLLSAREAARLMGLPDSYKLPARYNDAYHVAGDGLVVPVVRYLADTVIEPILLVNRAEHFLEAAE